jgi:Fur family ferric uptake transcriptional regulator
LDPLLKFSCYLSSSGLKATKQRQLVAEVFFRLEDHVSAEALYRKVSEQDPSIGLVTVYRTLRLLGESGLAREHRFGENSSRFEPVLPSAHHDHLICTRCGNVQEFENPKIENLQEEVASSYGFQIETHRLELYGVCKGCQGESQ